MAAVSAPPASLRGAQADARVGMFAFTGRVYSKADMRRQLTLVMLGDEAYAEVNSAWLRAWYPAFRQELFRMGVVKWEERFDCNRFAEIYTGLAQVNFFRQTFHRRTGAKALALGQFWYVRDKGGPHAIVQALTERGPVFIDPQTGEEMNLSPNERKSAYFQVF